MILAVAVSLLLGLVFFYGIVAILVYDPDNPYLSAKVALLWPFEFTADNIRDRVRNRQHRIDAALAALRQAKEQIEYAPSSDNQEWHLGVAVDCIKIAEEWLR